MRRLAAPACRTTTRRSPRDRAAIDLVSGRRCDPCQAWRAAAPERSASPPAISTSSSTQRIPEISGSSHSSKNTRGRARKAATPRSRMRFEIRLRAASASCFGLALAADQAAEHPDHLQDLGDGALVERHHRDAAADQLGARCRPADRRTPRTRSGCSASILSNFALMNAETFGFCRASGGRTV